MSRPSGVLLVLIGLVVATWAAAGMLAAIVVAAHGEHRSGVASFIWFTVGVATIVAGRAAIEEGSR